MMKWYKVGLTVNVPPYEAGVIANIAQILDPEGETDMAALEELFDSGIPFIIDCASDAYGLTS